MFRKLSANTLNVCKMLEIAVMGLQKKKQDRSLNYKWIARSVFKKSIPLEIVDARRAFRSPHNLLPKCPECGSSRFQKELQERDTAGCRLKHGDTYHLRRIRLCRNQLTAQRYFLAHIPDCCMKKSYSYFSKINQFVLFLNFQKTSNAHARLTLFCQVRH